MYADPVFTSKLFVCLNSEFPLIYQQKCLEELESKLIFETPFNKIMKPKIVKTLITVNSKHYSYHLKFVEVELHHHQDQKDS